MFGAADQPSASGQAPKEQPFTVRRIFLGEDGLRAIWGILLFLFFREAIADILGALAYSHLSQAHATGAPGQPAATLIAPSLLFIGEGIVFIALACATWLMAKIESRPLLAYGLGRTRLLANLASGLICGVVMLSILVLVLWRSGLLVFDGQLLFGRSAFRFGAIWVVGFLLVGLFEECFFRGYLQFTLARGLSGIYRWFGAAHDDALGFWTSAVLLSFGFAMTHQANAGESPIGILAAGLIGVVFCLSLWRTGSLWWAIGFHAAWDWAQSFLYGVADSGMMIEGHLIGTHPAGRPILSGGLTGPEGSIFILPIIALTATLILLTLPRTASARLNGGTTLDMPPETQRTRLHLDLP